MSEAILEHYAQDEEVSSMRIKEEACRQRIVALRTGLRTIFDSYGVTLNQGASNDDILWSVAQLCRKPSMKYVERWDTSWREEYDSFAQELGSLLEENQFTADTEPAEILQTAQHRFSGKQER